MVGVCAVGALGLVLLVRATTSPGKEKRSVWPSTAGFTLIVAAAAAAVSWLFRSDAPARAAADPAGLFYIFAVATVAAVGAFFVVLFFYRDHEASAPAAGPAKAKRSLGRILLDMVLVLRSGRFALFLAVMTGFFFLYNQVYNVLPLYAKRVVETNPADVRVHRRARSQGAGRALPRLRHLPLALGAILGGPVCAFIFNGIMAKGATKRPDGLLELDPTNNALGWLILMAIGLVSAASLWLFNRWLEKQKA